MQVADLDIGAVCDTSVVDPEKMLTQPVEKHKPVIDIDKSKIVTEGLVAQEPIFMCTSFRTFHIL